MPCQAVVSALVCCPGTDTVTRVEAQSQPLVAKGQALQREQSTQALYSEREEDGKQRTARTRLPLLSKTILLEICRIVLL